MIKIPPGPLMVDVGGPSLDPREIELLSLPAVGAVILFSRNFQSKRQVSSLIDEIKSLRQPPLLVAVDHEGGRVQRFKNAFHILPPACRFGEIFDGDRARALKLSHTAGRLMAKELIEVGVDFSFAPVLDCAGPNSAVIGDRAFHRLPDVIAELAGQYIRGMNAAGMAATGKHFPGHGGVVGDSHCELPVDTRTMDEIENVDLAPYFELAAGLGGVMTAHVQFPRIDSNIPTYSEFWIRSVLRNRIGFNGVVFSDDLTMQAARSDDTALQRAGRALRAGCDMAIVCNDPDAAAEAAANLEFDRTVGERLETMRPGPVHDDIEAARLKSALDELLTV